MGMGEEDWSCNREGERKEVGQRPSWEQEDEECTREEREAPVPDALQLFLVFDASSQVRQLCISTHLLQRNPTQRVVVGTHALRGGKKNSLSNSFAATH